MTKKMSMLLALVVSALSIMVIAVWTTTGESNNPIPINIVLIEDFDDLNDDGDKIKNIKDIVNEENLTYIIKYRIEPVLADDNQLTAFSDTDRVTVMIDVLSQEVYVFFGILDGLNSVTVTIKDEKTNKLDVIILMFKMPDEVIVPDLD